jgi:hypothetical protein
MIRRIALAATLFALPLPAYAVDNGGLAELAPMLRDLLARSGYGVHSFERGAFFVRETDGTIRCLLWPFTNQFQSISAKLIIPSGTIAIAHTHPNGQQQPSVRDREEAARLDIPMLVVSRDFLHLIGSAGEAAVRWNDLPQGRVRCAEAAPAPGKRAP